MGARPSSFKVEPELVEAPIVRPVWSKQQVAIIDWFKNGRFTNATPHLVVRARAGTGKTTTLLEGIEQAPEENILLSAFSNRIAKELRDRITNPNAAARTLHSVGLDCLRRVHRRLHVAEENTRARWLTKEVCPPTVWDSTQTVISKLHKLAREQMPHATCGDDLKPLAILHDCTRDGVPLDDICGYAYDAMELAAKDLSCGIDYADMIYLPLRNGLLRPRYGLIVVDEAQDMSAPQHEMIMGLLEHDGRMCVVGDDRQAIFAFRGADSSAIDRLKGELRAMELPLTITYRCGEAIVRHAQTIVPDIEPRPKAQAGDVGRLRASQAFAMYAPGDFVLSRTNAPLARVALNLIRDKRRCIIEGRDFGKMLLTIVKKVAGWGSITDTDQWLSALTEWELRESSRAERNDMSGKAAMIHDQAATLRVLAEDTTRVQTITERIDEMFDDSDGERSFIICSTVHKAKGLEASRVFALEETFNLPVVCVCGHRHDADGKCRKQKLCGCTRYVPSPEAEHEEENIRYVAITRAKDLFAWVWEERD